MRWIQISLFVAIALTVVMAVISVARKRGSSNSNNPLSSMPYSTFITLLVVFMFFWGLVIVAIAFHFWDAIGF